MWHLIVVGEIHRLVSLAALVFGVIAFVSCALQRADAFSAIGTLQKGAWLAILGLTTLFALIGGLFFAFFAFIASALYLLDVRPGLRDVAGGHNPW